MYLNRGSLPWQGRSLRRLDGASFPPSPGLKADTKKRKYEKIADAKARITTTELCGGYSGASVRR